MRFTIFCFAILFSFSLAGQSKKELSTEVARLKAEIEQLKKPKEADLGTVQKKVGYGIGVLIATNIKSSGGDSLDIDAIQAGLKDVWLNKPLKIVKDSAGPMVQRYMQHAAESKRSRGKGDNEKWLLANKTKEGVVTTASGLQYKVLKTGPGTKTPLATDKVTVNYKGSTIDGNEFDSSERHGAPGNFTVGTGIIAGWSEVLQLMHEGDKWTVYIPSELGWGERGAGGDIPPYATTIFDIELLKIN